MPPQIINECSKLPPFALWHIRKSRQWIPPFDLVGIESIILLDKCPKPTKNSYKNLKDAYDSGEGIIGAYSRKTEFYPAEIYLYMDALYFPIHKISYFSPVPTLYITRILAHEVAHHLVRTRGYIFTPDEKYPSYAKKPEYEEEMANRYAFSVVQRMRKKLLYKFGARLMKSRSDDHYISAMLKWKDKRYKEAADSWLKSFLLNSERKESLQWYWNAREKFESIQKAKKELKS